ncbi:MAG: hypothetical protein QXW35_03505 [Candidatus Aenigmatarchaeota archaeon]
MANKNRQRGKRAERKIAEKLGGRRVGILGKEDVITEKFIVEVKDRKEFVGEKFLMQAEKHKTDNKVCIAIVHIRGKRYEDSIVLIRLKDFKELVGC